MVSLISIFSIIACEHHSSMETDENHQTHQADHISPSTDERFAIDSDDDLCSEHINYQTVGKPFLTTWCTPCHNSNLPEGERAGAYTYANFDDYEQAQSHSSRILARIQDTAYPMPPAGGVPDDVLARMIGWIECGMPE